MPPILLNRNSAQRLRCKDCKWKWMVNNKHMKWNEFSASHDWCQKSTVLDNLPLEVTI
jgi:hypothetical protein